MKNLIAPIRNVNQWQNPWEGNCNKKPWQYKVTVAIPVLDTYEQLKICLDLLRKQTEKCYFCVIDTGSSEEELNKICSLRDEDLEVHSLRLNGVLHPSDFPAMAMDLAFTLCRTKLLFATHADCFLRRKDFIESLIELCPSKSSVVGYEISPRIHADWVGMVSHTASMYYMPAMDKIGFGWSLRRLSNYYDITDYRPNINRPQWPDTEILGNYILRNNNIVPYLIGKESNFERTVDENIDHFRSFTSGKLYSPDYYKKVNEWYEDAKKEANKRLLEW